MGRTDDTADLDRLAIAFHEAGHAVIHVVNGGRVSHLEILGNGAGNTCTVEDGPDEANPMAWLAMVMAGQAAETRFLTRNGYGQWKAESLAKHTAGGDHRNFRRDSRGTGISKGQALREAHRQVRKHWGRIERVAALLNAKGRISGSKV